MSLKQQNVCGEDEAGKLDTDVALTLILLVVILLVVIIVSQLRNMVFATIWA